PAGLGDQFRGNLRRVAVCDASADDTAALDIHDQVKVEVHPAHGGRQPSDIPAPHLIGASRPMQRHCTSEIGPADYSRPPAQSAWAPYRPWESSSPVACSGAVGNFGAKAVGTVSHRVGNPVSVEGEGYTQRQLDDGLRLAGEVARIENDHRAPVRVRVIDVRQQPAIVLRAIGRARYEDGFGRYVMRSEIVS